MIRYKLTTQDLKTHNGFQWEIGKKVTTDGSGELCSKDWLHCYSDPTLAVLLNPIHANIQNPKLFKVECSGQHKDDNGLKEGWTEMTLIEEIVLPKLTSIQITAFAILCSLEVYKEQTYVSWANNWLQNIDRSESAARSAAESAARSAARSAAESAAWSAAELARSAAHSAAWSAWSAWSAAELTRSVDFKDIIKKIKNIK